MSSLRNNELIMQNTTINYTKEDGEITLSRADEIRLAQFIKNLPEGTKVECYYSVILDPSEKTLRQLAKVHVMIKQLAVDTGFSISEMKKYIKNKAGIIKFNNKKEKTLKSFAECSKTELSSAIQECISVGDFVGSDIY